MTRALALMPDLLPPDVRKKNSENGVADSVADLEALVIEHGCGLRPARKGGIRVEQGTHTTAAGKIFPVVYNYGWVVVHNERDKRD